MKVLVLCLMGLTTALAQNPRLETNVSSVQLTLHKSDPQTHTFQIIVGNLSNHTLTEYCTIDEILQSCIVNLGLGPHKTAILIRPVGFLVAAGLFDNGTYQGDFDTAAKLAANQIAQQVQFQRARQIIDKALAVENDPLNFAVLEKGLTGLSEEPEEGMLLLARKEFPELSLDDPDRAALILQEGLRDLKTGLLVQLKSWKEQSSSRPPLSTWWKGIQESYMITWGEMANHDMTVPQCDQCPKFKRTPVIRTTTLVGEEPSAPPPAPKPVTVAAAPAAQPAEQPVSKASRPAVPVSMAPSASQAVPPMRKLFALPSPPQRPLTREGLYKLFFFQVRNIDLYSISPGEAGYKNYQRVIGLKDHEWKILKNIGNQCVDESFKINWIQAAAAHHRQKEPIDAFKLIDEKEKQVVSPCIRKLKLKLPAASFKKVDVYVQKQFMSEWLKTPILLGIEGARPASTQQNPAPVTQVSK